MKLNVVAIGHKPPSWVVTAFSEYAKRMPRELPLVLNEIPAPKHNRQNQSHRRSEAESILARLPSEHWVVALDETGQRSTSRELATQLTNWRMEGRDIDFVIGGADGLDKSVIQRADQKLRLSDLTLPHYLVRVVLAEALYRAWSIGAGHPYHRD